MLPWVNLRAAACHAARCALWKRKDSLQNMGWQCHFCYCWWMLSLELHPSNSVVDYLTWHRWFYFILFPNNSRESCDGGNSSLWSMSLYRLATVLWEQLQPHSAPQCCSLGSCSEARESHTTTGRALTQGGDGLTSSLSSLRLQWWIWLKQGGSGLGYFVLRMRLLCVAAFAHHAFWGSTCWNL